MSFPAGMPSCCALPDGAGHGLALGERERKRLIMASLAGRGVGELQPSLSLTDLRPPVIPPTAVAVRGVPSVLYSSCHYFYFVRLEIMKIIYLRSKGPILVPKLQGEATVHTYAMDNIFHKNH